MAATLTRPTAWVKSAFWLSHLFLACTSATAAEALRPFTAADSVHMTNIVQGEQYGLYKCTADGSRCAVVLRKGNLQTGMNEFTLSVLEAAPTLNFINDPLKKELPPLRRLVRFDTDYPYDAIDELRWRADGATLTFIGRKAGKNWIGQVYELDLKSGKVTQLTHHPYNVVQYTLAQDGTTLIYTAKEPPDWTERNKRGFVVEGNTLQDVLATNPTTVAPYSRYYVKTASERQPRALDIDEPNRGGARPVILSPSGRWAVVSHFLRRYPVEWSDYSTIKLFYGADDPPVTVGPDAQGQRWLKEPEFLGSWFKSASQLMLIDTKTGGVRPLLDAPAPSGPLGLWWSPDETRVVVGAAFAPLALCNDTERAACLARNSALVEVNLGSGKAALVDSSAVGASEVKWRSADDLRVTVGKTVRAYKRQSDRWSKTELNEEAPVGSTPRLVLSTVESPDVAPEIKAYDTQTKSERIITDLNPQFRELAMGRFETIKWKSEKLEQEFTGGLLLPPNFDVGKKYPVVLQDYGANPEFFLLTGPGNTAFSARALASRDIMVLNLGCWSNAPKLTGNWQQDGDAPRAATCLESAVDELDRRGLIDRTRVGLIGFSASGVHIMQAITFSKYPFAAATIADSAAATPWAYAWTYGTFRPGMIFHEKEWLNSHPFIGDYFWGKGVSTWVARSPVFNLDRVRTPLRYELVSYVPDTVPAPAYWDIYAILKRMNRPVEMIRLPNEEHDLQTPLKRYFSQQGNTDWFAFWLKGEERLAPISGSPETVDSLREQFERWRKLRTQRDRVLEEPAPP